VHPVQAEVAAVEVAVRVHAAARHQLAVPRIGPLVVRTHDPGDVTGVGLTDLHAAMATGVVQRVQPLVVAAHDDDRVGVEVEDDVVARALHLAAVAGEEPATAPDALEVELIDPGVGLELARQRMAGLVLGEQSIEQGLGLGKLRGGEEGARHRLSIIGGACVL